MYMLSFAMLAIASASILEIKLFLGSAAKGRIEAVIHDAEKLVAGVVIAVIPMVAYAASYFVTFSHTIAVLTMGGAAGVELTVASYMLKRS